VSKGVKKKIIEYAEDAESPPAPRGSQARRCWQGSLQRAQSTQRAPLPLAARRLAVAGRGACKERKVRKGRRVRRMRQLQEMRKEPPSEKNKYRITFVSQRWFIFFGFAKSAKLLSPVGLF